MPNNINKNNLQQQIGVVFASKFEIKELLGWGGFGAVYKAEPLPDYKNEYPNYVALKILLDEIRTHKDYKSLQERFRREAHAIKTLTALRLPNLAALYDFNNAEKDDLMYAVLEYVEGQTLQQILAQEKKLPANIVLEVARKVACVLDAVHRYKIVHRDVKPSNIMLANSSELSGQREVKLLDFGIAKFDSTPEFGDFPKLTETGVVFCTRGYAAPEVLSGKKIIDGRVDIFSLALVIYEMICGINAKEGKDFLLKPSQDVAKISLPPPGLSEEFNKIIFDALSLDPNDRPRTCEELVEQLDMALKGTRSKSPKNMPQKIEDKPFKLSNRFTAKALIDSDTSPYVKIYEAIDNQFSGRTGIAKIYDQRFVVIDSNKVELYKLYNNNIVNLLDSGILSEGNFFLVHEATSGTNLNEILKNGQTFDLEQVVHYGKEIALAVRGYHDKGLFYEYILPENIFVHDAAQRFSTLKLLSKVLLWDLKPTGNTVTKEFMAETRVISAEDHNLYRSVEQINGEEKDNPSAKIKSNDTYSIVVILIKMLVGNKLPGEDTSVNLGQKIDKAETILREMDNLPPNFLKLVKKGLSRDINERYSNASELFSALSEVFEHTNNFNYFPRENDRSNPPVVIAQPRNENIPIPPQQNIGGVDTQTANQSMVSSLIASVKKDPRSYLSLILLLLVLIFTVGSSMATFSNRGIIPSPSPSASPIVKKEELKPEEEKNRKITREEEKQNKCSEAESAKIDSWYNSGWDAVKEFRPDKKKDGRPGVKDCLFEMLTLCPTNPKIDQLKADWKAEFDRRIAIEKSKKKPNVCGIYEKYLSIVKDDIIQKRFDEVCK